MKLKKIAACVMSLTLIFGVCTSVPDLNIFSTDEVSAMGIVPYSLSATLEDNTFELTNGEVITKNDLLSHGIDITETIGWFHDMPEDVQYQQLTPTDPVRTQKHTIDECSVCIPDKLVNGLNTIYITYRQQRTGISFAKSAKLDVNVKYTDATANEAVYDYLPYHIDRTPTDILQYSCDENGEYLLDVSQESADEYVVAANNQENVLIYDGQDIEKIKADFPELKVSEINETVPYKNDTQLKCENMSQDKTYYMLDAEDISKDEFAALCSKIKAAGYGDEMNQVRFVSTDSPEFIYLSFDVRKNTKPRSVDFQGVWCESITESSTEPGRYFVEGKVYNEHSSLNDVFDFCEHTDWKNFRFKNNMDLYTAAPSWCYMQPLSSVDESAAYLKDIAFGYSCVKYPEVQEDTVEYELPDLGRDFCLNDMTQLSQWLMHDIEFTDEQIKADDLTGDGDTNLADLAMMKQYIMMGKVVKK